MTMRTWAVLLVSWLFASACTSSSNGVQPCPSCPSEQQCVAQCRCASGNASCGADPVCARVDDGGVARGADGGAIVTCPGF